MAPKSDEPSSKPAQQGIVYCYNITNWICINKRFLLKTTKPLKIAVT